MASVRPAAPADLESVFTLLDARSRATFGDAGLERSWVEQAWELSDKWVAERDGRVVGYAAIDSSQTLTHAAQDDETGDALLEAALAGGRGRGFSHVEVTTVEQDLPLSSLVRRNGFERHREILRMWRRLDGESPAPQIDGVQVRTYHETDAGAVHELLDSAYGGWDTTYVRRPHEDWLAFMTRHDEFDPRLWFLAEREGDLVACALYWREQRGGGWLKDIAVRDELRGRGLGSALLQHGFHAFGRRGAHRIGLKVDAANPTGAVHAYARAGFTVDRRYEIWTKPL